MEKMTDYRPWNDMGPNPPVTPPPAEKTFAFPTGKKDLLFALLALISGLMMCNFVIYGGFHLGFAIAMCTYILIASGYLILTRKHVDLYGAVLLLLSLFIAAGFGRSDDGFVKFVMVCFLTVSVNLGLCLMAGQNRHATGGAGSLLDAGRTVFTMGYGQFPRALAGLFGSLKFKNSRFKTIGSVVIGLLIMLPLMVLVISLLIKADAAFDNLMKYIPEFELSEALTTVLLGIGVFVVMYSRVVALAKRAKEEPVSKVAVRGLNKITMNTVLIGLCLVYTLYLVSQLAYFVGGFSGIVPENYTMAEYARRGFFEMAWLCAINMGLIIFAIWLVRKNNGKAPLSTRLLCLFLGLVTLFLVTVASAKMWTYIGGYGLTRLRVMTQLIILFFGLMALTLSFSLFTKKPRYLPLLLIVALLLGGSAFWVDVDTLVASYNVHAYQTGNLKTIDVAYLGTLSNGAIPQIAKLLDDADPEVAKAAAKAIQWEDAVWEDFRDWNYADWCASSYITEENQKVIDEQNDRSEYRFA